jgi:hypothetical protein
MSISIFRVIAVSVGLACSAIILGVSFVSFSSIFHIGLSIILGLIIASFFLLFKYILHKILSINIYLGIFFGILLFLTVLFLINTFAKIRELERAAVVDLS